MCDVCNGHPNCPCCSDEGSSSTCQECNGTGKIFYADVKNDGDFAVVTKAEYDKCPYDKDYETCSHCDGEGWIAEEEYSYDDYLDERFEMERDER